MSKKEKNYIRVIKEFIKYIAPKVNQVQVVLQVNCMSLLKKEMLYMKRLQ